MGQTEKVNILMVDDQPGKLLSYETILAELDENLIKAGSGREALEILLKTDVAVVLMDVSMPDMDGFETAELIRQHPRFQKTAIIFISAVHLTDLDRVKGYERGAVDYISVPVVPELLRAKVSVFAELHRKTRKLETINSELEQRVAERTEELRSSADALRERAELLDLATEAILVREMNGVLKFWNSGAEALYGWKRDEVIGKQVHDVLQTVYPVPAAEMKETITRHGRWNGNLVQFAKDGRRLIVESRQALKMEELGEGVLLEINRDITSQLRAEEALRRSERLAAMGRVAGIIAHEVNNPLEAITNAVFLLRAHKSLDDEAQNLARMAEEELARVSYITRQTLSFYRESSEAIPISLASVLDNVLELQARSLRLSGITLEKQYCEAAEIHGFPAELKQVFLNLVGNAIQAMPQGGRLRIRISNGNGTKKGVRVSVSDTGVGIRREERNRLFEPFFTTKATHGTGLGLWISKGIVQKYGGTIQFRSIRVNGARGTCFSVFLPIEKTQVARDYRTRHTAIAAV
jgi:PAS domain S-box-containing protein